jgi:hypothetical protein
MAAMPLDKRLAGTLQLKSHSFSLVTGKSFSKILATA